MKVDFHIHSTYSDGDLEPETIITTCQQLGIINLAITDHDTIIGYNQYQKLAEELKLNIIPAIEITTDYRKLHILGYNIKDIDKIEGKMLKLRESNIDICNKVIELLNNNGIFISLDEVKNNSHDGIVDKKSIVKTMIANGYVSQVVEAYDKYIGKKAHYYIPINKYSITEAINIIKAAGGVAVIAHPFFSGLAKDNNIENEIIKIKNQGAGGVEVYYRYHTKKELQALREICIRHKLIMTGGSDFHNYESNNFFGVNIPEEEIKKLIMRRNK